MLKKPLPMQMRAGEHRRTASLVGLGIPVINHTADLADYPEASAALTTAGVFFVYSSDHDKACRVTAALIIAAHDALILANQVGLRSVAQSMCDSRTSRAPIFPVERAILDPNILAVTSLRNKVLENIFPADLQRFMGLINRRVSGGKTTVFATDMSRADVMALFTRNDLKSVVTKSHVIKVDE